VHRYRTLLPEEITSLDGLPITTPARTLLDLAGRADGRELEKAVAEALARGLTTAQGIGAVLECHLGWPGTSRLRALLGEHTPAFTRSRAEARFLALVRRAQLPVPRANARFNGFEVDFLWRDERLVTELDGFAFHSSASAFENDRRRDALLTAAGMRVMRVTWRQLVKEPEALMVRLGLALARTEASARASG
jgi:very-short-patch-repair endonuclease